MGFIKKLNFLSAAITFSFCSFAFCENPGTFDLKTKAAESINQTYSDIQVLPERHPTTNFSVRFDFKVVKQNRLKKPQAWETFWLFWSYIKETGDSKKTNYLAFKTNGLELGKSFAITDQVFVWTSEAVKFEIGKWYHVELKLIKKQMSLKVNDIEIAVAADVLEKTFQTPGQIAFYTEDADVSLKNYSYEILK